ncbi:MAG: 50S ribosomal protein L18 [Anaerolineae bacterium]|jgi:large subunit ribosomal protein L18|nr:50S ribosomal protein L18 [Anaerolineae bacterium]
MGELKSKEKVEARARRHKRIRSHLAGTPDRPRLNVFRSLANIYVQVIDDAKGVTLVSASTLDKDVVPQIQGKNKTDAARIVGKVAAERAKSAGITKVVFDRGGYRYHGRIAAVAEGAREAGLEF